MQDHVRRGRRSVTGAVRKAARARAKRTTAVHYFKFRLSSSARAKLAAVYANAANAGASAKGGASVSALRVELVSSHPVYSTRVELSPALVRSLVRRLCLTPCSSHRRAVRFEESRRGATSSFLRATFFMCHDAMAAFFDQRFRAATRRARRRARGLGLPAVHTECDYAASLRFGDVARIEAHGPARWRTTSVTIRLIE